MAKKRKRGKRRYKTTAGKAVGGLLEGQRDRAARDEALKAVGWGEGPVPPPEPKPLEPPVAYTPLPPSPPSLLSRSMEAMARVGSGLAGGRGAEMRAPGASGARALPASTGGYSPARAQPGPAPLTGVAENDPGSGQEYRRGIPRDPLPGIQARDLQAETGAAATEGEVSPGLTRRVPNLGGWTLPVSSDRVEQSGAAAGDQAAWMAANPPPEEGLGVGPARTPEMLAEASQQDPAGLRQEWPSEASSPAADAGAQPRKVTVDTGDGGTVTVESGGGEPQSPGAPTPGSSAGSLESTPGAAATPGPTYGPENISPEEQAQRAVIAARERSEILLTDLAEAQRKYRLGIEDDSLPALPGQTGLQRFALALAGSLNPSVQRRVVVPFIQSMANRPFAEAAFKRQQRDKVRQAIAMEAEIKLKGAQTAEDVAHAKIALHALREDEKNDRMADLSVELAFDQAKEFAPGLVDGLTAEAVKLEKDGLDGSELRSHAEALEYLMGRVNDPNNPDARSRETMEMVNRDVARAQDLLSEARQGQLKRNNADAAGKAAGVTDNATKIIWQIEELDRMLAHPEYGENMSLWEMKAINTVPYAIPMLEAFGYDETVDQFQAKTSQSGFIKSFMLNLLSGAAISAHEMVRMEKFLPDPLKDTNGQMRIKLEHLHAFMTMNRGLMQKRAFWAAQERAAGRFQITNPDGTPVPFDPQNELHLQQLDMHIASGDMMEGRAGGITDDAWRILEAPANHAVEGILHEGEKTEAGGQTFDTPTGDAEPGFFGRFVEDSDILSGRSFRGEEQQP